MNENIKEIALQAGGSHYPDVGGVTLEKFAQMIVQECAEQIRLKGTDWIDWMPSQQGIRPEYVAMAQHIKQHFGVEE
jgi:hypothetical protein